ncbi:MAG TPA: helix-turn-helix domain-containing protein [Gemmatimonadaceae bacterium]|nr:helix-turn-helix domain-containing protein [Gemmatimonadaceae bacterium]
MVSRERILEAAARVYAKHGFRGATTRLIAAEAGVNEVTLFRTFGSKGALLEAVLEANDHCQQIRLLPDPPVDPEEELTAWVNDHLRRVRDMRPMLIHAISELDERPEVAEFACRGRVEVHVILDEYVAALRRLGRADPEADTFAAVTMLISSVMGDAMGRSMAPDSFPPAEEAARRYVRCFLRAIGAGPCR